MITETNSNNPMEAVNEANAKMQTVNYLSLLLRDKQITDVEYRAELYKIGIGDGKPISSVDAPK